MLPLAKAFLSLRRCWDEIIYWSLLAEIIQNHSFVGLPEFWCCIWWLEHLAHLCLQEHLLGQAAPSWGRCWDPWSPFSGFLDSYSHRTLQVHYLCASSRWWWRRCFCSSQLVLGLLYSALLHFTIYTGGTFALYSLMCRNSKMGLLSTPHAAQEHLTAYNPEVHCDETRTSLSIKRFIEKNQSSRLVLLLFVLLGTSMVIGDGVLTPTMSGKMLNRLCIMLESENNFQFPLYKKKEVKLLICLFPEK